VCQERCHPIAYAAFVSNPYGVCGCGHGLLCGAATTCALRPAKDERRAGAVPHRRKGGLLWGGPEVSCRCASPEPAVVQCYRPIVFGTVLRPRSGDGEAAVTGVGSFSLCSSSLSSPHRLLPSADVVLGRQSPLRSLVSRDVGVTAMRLCWPLMCESPHGLISALRLRERLCLDSLFSAGCDASCRCGCLSSSPLTSHRLRIAPQCCALCSHSANAFSATLVIRS
jgi:hypothetical protein